MARFLAPLLLVGICAAVASGQPPKADADAVAYFEKKIRPVLVAECYECHSSEKGKKAKGGLALDTREGIRKGGETGPAVVPGKPADSLLLKAMSHADPKLAMPPKRKLDAAVVKDFEEWVKAGAADPRDGAASTAWKYPTLEQGRKHWAYQPVREPAVPKGSAWATSPVDAFIVEGWKAKGLSPVADADKRTLLRRVTFDLTGLPPTTAEVEAFEKDGSPEAFEKVVDRLLASPAFGETWARHWLDVARFAESTGKTVNFSYPQAWRYRDYVIAAFNADKPYDQFVKEQLAGDLMKSDDPKVTAERLIATGFLALGPKTLNERNGLKFELDTADEQIDVTTQAFLGVTAACARCHDHKFDPISQAEYYSLAGIFRSTETCYGTVRFINAQRVSSLLPLPADGKPVVAVDKLTDAERKGIEEQIQRVKDTVKSMKDPTQQFLTSGQIGLLQAKLDAYHADGHPKLLAMGVRDKPAGPEPRAPRGGGGFAGFTYDGQKAVGDSPLFTRGEADQPGDSRIPRGTPVVLTGTPVKMPAAASGRLELAGWIATKENPLTARVMANRVWLHLFGRGLVSTAADFGLAGHPPTHPALLDHLAGRFVADGWSVKKLVRSLVLTRVYRLGSTADRKALEVDPDNTLLWRMTPRRLDAEMLRDAILAVSGQLETKPPVGSVVAKSGEGPVSQFGPGGNRPLAAVNDPQNVHRSVYLPVIRDNLPESLALFDAADPSLIASDRPRTTVPAQGLFLMNNPFVLRAADATAEKLLMPEGGESDRIRGAFVRFFARPATDKEVTSAEAFLKAYRSQLNKDGVRASQQDREAWSAFCQALFASAEFQFR